MAITKTEELIQRLYATTAELRAIYGLKFPLDGLLVGDIGEAWAAESLALTLLAPGAPIHDAYDSVTKRHIQIKTTQNNSVALKNGADELLVLKLHKTGKVEVVWHGDNALAWDNAGKEQRNGERTIRFSKLERLPQSGRHGQGAISKLPPCPP